VRFSQPIQVLTGADVDECPECDFPAAAPDAVLEGLRCSGGWLKKNIDPVAR